MAQPTHDINFFYPANRTNVSVEITQPQSIGEALQTSCPLSLTELKRAMTCGAVWLKRTGCKTRRVRKASFTLSPGDRVSLYYDSALLRRSVEQPVNLFTHSNYSIWYKPPGMVTQGTKFGDHLSLLRIAEQTLKLHNRIHLIHRLDRDARGIILLAHNKKSSANLSRQFRDRLVAKLYWARVEGRLVPEGKVFEIDMPLDSKDSTTMVTVGRHDPENRWTDLQIVLKTGRYHQIRRHLAAINHPLVGDRKYSKVKKNPSEEMQLCAYGLSFKEPGGTRKVSYRLPSTLLPFSV